MIFTFEPHKALSSCHLPALAHLENKGNDIVHNTKLVSLFIVMRDHWHLRTTNSRLFLPWFCFPFMGVIIFFATDCVSTLLWLLVNLQPNLRLISSSGIVSYGIHYVLSNLPIYPIFLISSSSCCIFSPLFLKFIPLYAGR